MAKVVMSNLMSNNQSNLGIRAAELVKAARKVDVTPWCGKRRNYLHPRNLDDKALSFRSRCLETIHHSPDAIECPSLRLKVNSFVQTIMKPFPERPTLFKLEITSHIGIPE